jgi:hypothetical protein
MNKEKPIWEQYGISIEEYGRALNEELSAAAERLDLPREEIKDVVGRSVYLIDWQGER